MDVDVKSDKPYYTWDKMKNDQEFKLKVKQLLDSLLNNEVKTPENCIRWNNLDEIE